MVTAWGVSIKGVLVLVAADVTRARLPLTTICSEAICFENLFLDVSFVSTSFLEIFCAEASETRERPARKP